MKASLLQLPVSTSMQEFECRCAPGHSAQSYVDLRYLANDQTTCRSGGGLRLQDCHQVGSPVASSLEPAASACSPSLQSALKALDQQVDALRKGDHSAPFKPTLSLRIGDGGVMRDRSQTEDTLGEPGHMHKFHARDDVHDVIPEAREDEPADPAVPVRRDEGLAQPAHRRGIPVRSVDDDAPIAKAHESINSFMHSIVGSPPFFMQEGLHAHGESLRSKSDDASTGFSMPWCTLPSDTDGETDNEAAPGSERQGQDGCDLHHGLLKALDQQVDALRKGDHSAPFKPTLSLRIGDGGVMRDRSQTEDTLGEPGHMHKFHARDDVHDVIPEAREDEPADPAVPVRRDEGLAQPAHRRGIPVRSVDDDAPIAKAHESINSFMHSIVGSPPFFMQEGLHAHGESLRSKSDDASTGFSMPWCTLPSDTDGETDNEADPGSDCQREPAASAGSPSLQSVLKELDQQLDALRKRSNSSLVEPSIGFTLGTGEDGVIWESSHPADRQFDDRAESSDHDTSALQHVTRCEAEECSGDQLLQHHSASTEADSLRSAMSASRESTPTTLPCRALAPLPLLDLGSLQSQSDRDRDADENALRLHLLTMIGKATEEMSCGWREGPHSEEHDAFFVGDWLKQLQDPQRRQRVSDMLHRSNHSHAVSEGTGNKE